MPRRRSSAPVPAALQEEPGPAGLRVLLRMGPSPRGGLGMFALDPLPAGTVVEEAPVLEVSDVVRGELPDRCIVLDADDPDRVGIPLGYGALYNHAADPNLEWEVDGLVMRMTTTRAVPAGEELCIDYGPDWFPERGLEPL